MTGFLDVLARLEAEATPGPWYRMANYIQNYRAGDFIPADAATICSTFVSGSNPRRDADAAFIAAFRNAAPLLIEVARAAETYLDYTGGHSYRCEYRTAAKGWKGVGNPPIIECECGLEDLDAALSALRAETERGGT